MRQSTLYYPIPCSIAIHPDRITVATGQVAGHDDKEGKVFTNIIIFKFLILNIDFLIYHLYSNTEWVIKYIINWIFAYLIIQYILCFQTWKPTIIFLNSNSSV